MFNLFGSGGRTRLVSTTAKIALTVGFLSLLATNWLSRNGLDHTGLARLAGGASRVEEPTMTGSLAKAREVRLDPCAAPKRP